MAEDDDVAATNDVASNDQTLADEYARQDAATEVLNDLLPEGVNQESPSDAVRRQAETGEASDADVEALEDDD